eukprot:Skav212152  [mRNA]  locus=scaffold754:63599:68056:+ [translate_table: standard]
MRMCWDHPDWEGSESSRCSRFMKGLEWVVIGLEVMLALILLLFGTGSSLRTIAEEWSTFGEPFECHCEGLWKTCNCSASHPGMAEVCPLPT